MKFFQKLSSLFSLANPKLKSQLKSSLKNYFLAGLLVIVPLGITIWIISWIITFTDGILDIIPPVIHPRTYIPIPGWGFIIVLLVILLAGVLATNLFGKRLLAFGNNIINRIPFVRAIYSATRQIMEALFMQTGKNFQRVVMIEYPRKGIYALGFVTGKAWQALQNSSGKKMVSIFLPSTPNPTTGFYLMVPEEEIIELDISIEEAAKIIISGGMIPDKLLEKKISS